MTRAATRPASYENSVFINCPFDPAHQDLMLSIVFTVAAHGYVPQTARASEGTPEPRFSRILRMISQCKYSIHDLSRSTGEGDDNLARFNMPLELGMSAAFRFEREASKREPHLWLALVPEGFAYQRFISDLAGFDPARHDSSVKSVIREVSAWLKTLDEVLPPVPSALKIFENFPAFREQLANLRTEALNKDTWSDVLSAASQTVPKP